jgi:hypothetical protein
MIITLDTTKKQIIFNGKMIDVDPMYAFTLAPEGTIVEVIGNVGGLVTLKLTVPTPPM